MRSGPQGSLPEERREPPALCREPEKPKKKARKIFGLLHRTAEHRMRSEREITRLGTAEQQIASTVSTEVDRRTLGMI